MRDWGVKTGSADQHGSASDSSLPFPISCEAGRGLQLHTKLVPNRVRRQLQSTTRRRVVETICESGREVERLRQSFRDRRGQDLGSRRSVVPSTSSRVMRSSEPPAGYLARSALVTISIVSWSST